MRRIDREITAPDEILAVIKQCKVLRLAMNAGKVPYIVPMNFGYSQTDDKRFIFYCHCAKEGRKIDLLRRDPNVCFEMDAEHELLSAEEACGYSYYYASVMGEGTVRFLEGAEKCEALSALMRHQTGKEFPFTKEQLEAVAILAVETSSLSAKRHAKPAQ